MPSFQERVDVASQQRFERLQIPDDRPSSFSAAEKQKDDEDKNIELFKQGPEWKELMDFLNGDFMVAMKMYWELFNKSAKGTFEECFEINEDGLHLYSFFTESGEEIQNISGLLVTIDMDWDNPLKIYLGFGLVEVGRETKIHRLTKQGGVDNFAEIVEINSQRGVHVAFGSESVRQTTEEFLDSIAESIVSS